jgi:GNAT superfamily N-acetyltransferase
MSFEIRKATAADAGIILGFIRELAVYEKEPDAVVATKEDIAANLFNPRTTTEAVIGLSEGRPVGFAVYFMSFSTWLGRDGLYLEDLYVSTSQRGKGFGKALLKHLARIASDRNCGRFEWSVLDWNEPAIRFYESLGARAQSEWVGYRLEGQALVDLAND